MARYVTIKLTAAQAQAASNACDLIRDQLDADGDKREAACYERASAAIDKAVESTSLCGRQLNVGTWYGTIRCGQLKGHDGRCLPFGPHTRRKAKRARREREGG